MKKIITLLLTLITLRSVGQEISGRVLDDKKEPLLSAAVQVYQRGILKGGNVTDYDGNYTVKPLDPGDYDLLVFYAGYDSVMVTNIVVIPGQRTTTNITMQHHALGLKEIIVKAYKMPLIDYDRPSSKVLTREEISYLPATQINNAIAGTYQSQRSGAVNMSGARTTGALYIIDGVQVQNASSPAQNGNNTVFFDPSEESYKKNTENDFMNVKVSPMSTMSVDVDHASYSNIRRFINDGQKPPADAVRVEEMINYFDYKYPQPKDNAPIAIVTELTDCPWQKGHQLLHIGMQAKKVNIDELPPSNLVFLIDVSGSMYSEERLPLLIAGLKLLVQELRPIDMVSIVTYAGSPGLALPATSGNNKQKITDALDRLTAGGSTAGGAGIVLAYNVAKENFIKGGNNRVLLATDGDFNVGVSSDNELEDLIVKERGTGIFLTCLGFGTGNYKDAKMEMLADKGNGNYDYIDNLAEAQKTLVHEFGGTLFTVAKDVKAQIEFNPEKVQGYRLIGYENRLLNTEDFKDDKKDAGDMGSGHAVTIIYELIPVGVKSEYMRQTNDLKYQRAEKSEDDLSDELATIKFRYKEPDGQKSKEMTHIIADNEVSYSNATENTRFSESVAMFGMLLRGSKYMGTSSYEDVINMAKKSKEYDKEGYRTEFIKLVAKARDNASRTSAR